MVEAQFPEHLKALFKPKRYKILFGGRGAGRSWGAIRALLILGTQKRQQVLCARELQNSIAESVHRLLAQQIDSLGMNYLYEVQQAKIIQRELGGEFTFEGIKNNTNKIKSYEGIDICLVEEADKTSKASWDILIPTIRKEGSEIWMNYNPQLATDYTHKRFALDPKLKLTVDPDLPAGVKESDQAYAIFMTWKDNPWFPEALRAEMLDMKERDYDSYLNIWEGHCRETLEGAVYAKQLQKAQFENRICDVGWDKESPVDTFWDLGYSDATCIWFAQRVGNQNRILAYFEDRNEDDVSYYLRELQSRGYVYGTHWLPHDAKAKRLGTKRTIEEQIKQAYPGMVRIVPRLSVEDGINAARMIFGNCWFDQAACEDGLQALRHYKFRVIDGQLSQKPEHSDGADGFRYLAIALRGSKEPSNLLEKLQAPTSLGSASRLLEAGKNAITSLSWMG